MDIAQVQQFFFKAMLEGWTTGGQEVEMPNMPGYTALPFQEGDLRLIDCYCVNPMSRKSAGTTTISLQGIPVWVMHYGGFYEEGAIVFLKQALLKVYQDHEFIGGRGPRLYVRGDLLYVNEPDGDFTKFNGREEIFNIEDGLKNKTSLGFHEYWGMSLL